MTLGELLLLEGGLANAIYLGWWQVPIRGSPLQFEELGTFWISDQGGSWIKIMSKWERVSRMMFVMSEFLQTFCEKIFSLWIIIDWTNRLLQNGVILICFHRSQCISWYAIPYWICASRMNKHWSRLGDLLCNWNTWMNVGIVHPSWFLIWESLA